MDMVDIRHPQKPKSAPVNLPKSAEERAEALISLMERLTAHLEQETRTLADRRVRDIAALVKAKQPMALVAEEMGRLLRIDREGLSSLPLDLKERLRETVRALNAATDANIGTLDRMAGAQQLLVDTIVDAVNRDRKLNHPAYGPAAGGRYANGPSRVYAPPTNGPATSATLNTNL